MIIEKPKNFDLDQIYASGQVFRWEEGCGMVPECVQSKYAGVFQQYIFYYETNGDKK